MRMEVMEYIVARKDLQQFLREQPVWYRKLSRNPNDLEAFETASLYYFEKTIPHRVAKFSNGVQMASMMFQMLQSMKNSNQGG
ncbi:YlbE-like family protein [Bacillus sp. FJAT-27245]|uniref:YlbE-like family protein n=1 Tax=Bacillus sp. FJAT-27245 TaxID=1684144 RepID=UPI0006A7A604|nr:YlbE-like family protein [Bacillus sp. FJAT-27245]